MFWCNKCKPDEIILTPERIQVIYSYVEALLHVKEVCAAWKGDLNYLIHALAEAVGDDAGTGVLRCALT
jgi:hypothetical protein